MYTPACFLNFSTGLFQPLFGIGHKDTSAIFADDKFLALANLHLALRGNPVEATAAGIALHGHDRQPVAHIAADAAIGRQQALVDLGLDPVGLYFVLCDLGCGFGFDPFQFVLLGSQVGGTAFR